MGAMQANPMFWSRMPRKVILSQNLSRVAGACCCGRGGVGSRCDKPISLIPKTHTLDSYQHPSRDDLCPEVQADQGHVCSIAVDGGEEESDQGGQLPVDELYSCVPLFHRRERGPGDRCAWPMEVVEDFEHAVGVGEAPKSPETPGGEQEE